MRRSLLSCRQGLKSSSSNIRYSRRTIIINPRNLIINHPHSSSALAATTTTTSLYEDIISHATNRTTRTSSACCFSSSVVGQHIVSSSKENHDHEDDDDDHHHVSVVLDDSTDDMNMMQSSTLANINENNVVDDDKMNSISNNEYHQSNDTDHHDEILLASTANESLDRLIELMQEETTTGEISSLMMSDRQREKLEYSVIRQIFRERQLNDIVTSNNDELIEYAIKNYPWSHENMWNLLLDGSSSYNENQQRRRNNDNPEYAEYAWRICSMWNATKPNLASLGMYQWGLSILASHGLYERSLSILRHLKKKQQQQQQQQQQQVVVVSPDINCYHYGLMACQYHIGTQINLNDGRKMMKSKKQKQQRGRSRQHNNNKNRRGNNQKQQQQEQEPNYVDIQKAAYEIYQEAPYPRPIHFYRTYLSMLANNPLKEKQQQHVLGQRSLQVLQDMKSSSTSSSLNDNDGNNNSSNNIMEMDLLCHNLVLKTLARNGDYNASTRILESMIQWKGELRDRDDDDTDNDNINDLTTLPKQSSASSSSSSSAATTTPNLVISFHTVLKAFLEANNIQAAEQAEQVLEIMWKVANLKKRPDYEPTSRAYQQVIAIWVKLGQPQRALSLLEELQNLYKQNKNHNSKFLPDAICYKTVIGGLAKVSDRRSKYNSTDDDDVNDIAAAAAAAATTTKTEIAEQATLVLRDMYDIGHDIDAVAINMCLKCWTNAGKIQDAERLMEEISSGLWGKEAGIKLDIISYNTIIAAYSKQGNSVRAQELLDRLLEHQKQEGATNHSSELGGSIGSGTSKKGPSGENLPKPNTVTFTSVISALGKKGTIESAEAAERLLLQMQELYEDYGYDTRPNMYTYNALLYCWSNFDDPDIQAKIGAPRAELILRNMQEHLGGDDDGSDEDQPNVVTYNTIIQAHSHSEFDKVERLCKEMIFDQRIEPNSSTRNTVMRILYRGITHEDKPINMKHDMAHDIAVKYFQNVPAQHKQSRKKQEAARNRWQ